MKIRRNIVMPFLYFLLLFSVIAAVTFGSTEISLKEVCEIIGAVLFDDTVGINPIHGDIIWLLRLPRIILAVCVGCGLAVCGVVMQAIVRNPLADPYVLGISSGASLGATLAIFLGTGTFGAHYIGAAAAAGAFAAAMGVLLLAHAGGRSSSVKLLLAGMALNALCSAAASFVVYFAHDKEGIQTITYWLMGSLAHAQWPMLAVIFPLFAAGSAFFAGQSRILNLMLLGDETAITLGTDLHGYRQLYLIVVAVIVGFAVYASGMIGFVGLVIPHVFRMLLGTDHRLLVGASALGGAIFLIWADVLCRVIIPGSELPIGILISLIGAPCFVYLMLRQNYGFGGN